MIINKPVAERGINKEGETAMKAKEGDMVRSLLNGIYYKVKRIVNRMAVLESQNGKSQVLTEVDTLNIFYQKMKEAKA
jgi:hypothetical protein